MIDIENEIFSKVAMNIREAFPNIYIVGEYVKSPPSFPCVSLIEMSNTSLASSLTQDSLENHAELMYEMNVYSNKSKAKKAECKEIASFVDEILQRFNFTRITLQPIPNENESNIYRMVGRYRAVVSKDKVIYRR